MRDAVDYVVARVREAEPDRRSPSASTLSRAARVRRSTTRRCCAAPSPHRSWCAEHPGHAVERASRVPRRRRARAGRHRASSTDGYPRPARGRAHRGARRRWSTPARWPRSPTSIGLGDVPAARQGRGRRRRPARSRRSSPTRSRPCIGAVYLDGGVEAAKALVARLFGERHRRRRRPARAASTTRPCCRS